MRFTTESRSLQLSTNTNKVSEECLDDDGDDTTRFGRFADDDVVNGVNLSVVSEKAKCDRPTVDHVIKELILVSSPFTSI